MGKRKALEMNGEDEITHRTTTLSSTNRSLGNSPSTNLLPSGLFAASEGGKSTFLRLDDKVSEKMTKVNESFVANLAITLSEQPDALLFPIVESYVRHVHAILMPHLPKKLALVEDKSLLDIARFLDKFRTSVGSESDEFGDKSDVNNVEEERMEVGKKIDSNVFAGFKFKAMHPPASNLAGNPSKNPSASASATSPPRSDYFSTNYNASKSTTVPTLKSDTGGFSGFDKNPTKSNGIVPGIFSSPKSNTEPIGGVNASGFSFTPILPISSTSNSTAHNDNQDDQEDDAPEEPPKNEFKQVIEDGAVYTVRCKLFGKEIGSKEQYKDKGVGQLYVKKLSIGKYQVVVRAENTLGTILLNILLQKGSKIERQGAKDVLTLDPGAKKPMLILIRVKTSEAADELLNKLQEFAAESS